MKKIYTLSLTILFAALTAGNLYAQNTAWKFYRPGNTGVGGDYFNAMTIDSAGNKWFGAFMPYHDNGSLTMFNDSFFVNYSDIDGYIPWYESFTVEIDHAARVWFGTKFGLSIFDQLNGTWTTYTSSNSPLNPDGVYDAAFDSQNNAWLVTGDQLQTLNYLVKFDGTTWTTLLINNQAGISPISVAVDHSDNIWVGTQGNSLYRYDGTTWTHYVPFNQVSSDYIYDIDVDSSGTVWCASDLGVDYFNGSTWQHYNDQNSTIPFGDAKSIDVRGNKILVGIDASGGQALFEYFNGTSWSQYDVQAPSFQNNCKDVAIDNDGTLWVIGWGYAEHFNPFTSQHRYFDSFTTSFNDMNFQSLFIDSKNRKWIASDGTGVSMWDGTNWYVNGRGVYGGGFNPLWLNYPDITQGTVGGEDICEDPFGNIWITYNDFDGSIVKVPNGDLTDTAAFEYFNTANAGVNLSQTNKIKSNNTGDIWAGSAFTGISIFNQASQTWSHVTSTVYTNAGVWDLEPDNGNGMWVATGIGLYHFDGINWTVFNSSNSGLTSDYVTDIDKDSQGNLWLATTQGLVKYNGTVFTIYTESNSGLHGDLVSDVAIGPGDTIYASSANIFAFPAYGGVSIFDGINYWDSLTVSNSDLPASRATWLDFDTLGNLWMNVVDSAIAVYLRGNVSTGIIKDNLYQARNSPKLYPNPATKEINLSGINLNVGDKIQVINTVGKIIYQTIVAPRNLNLKIKTVNFPAGIYFVKINSDKKLYSSKFIKE
jgi:ligand-binding sensor domain-containing protein